VSDKPLADYLCARARCSPEIHRQSAVCANSEGRIRDHHGSKVRCGGHHRISWRTTRSGARRLRCKDCEHSPGRGGRVRKLSVFVGQISSSRSCATCSRVRARGLLHETKRDDQGAARWLAGAKQEPAGSGSGGLDRTPAGGGPGRFALHRRARDLRRDRQASGRWHAACENTDSNGFSNSLIIWFQRNA